MAVDMAVSALDLNLAEERGPPQQRPASPALSVSSSSSSSAESSSDSSDSSSEGEGEEGEEEGEESESNITPTLEKVSWRTLHYMCVIRSVVCVKVLLGAYIVSGCTFCLVRFARRECFP